jgi:hypothetical protein
VSSALSRIREYSLFRELRRGVRTALWLTLLLVLPRGAHTAGRSRSASQSQVELPTEVIDVLPTSSNAFSANSNFVGNRKRMRMLNMERQKSIISDADKLLRLTRELNDEISRVNPDSLTADQLHKIAEIEKLAHNVKEKMSYPVAP